MKVVLGRVRTSSAIVTSVTRMVTLVTSVSIPETQRVRNLQVKIGSETVTWTATVTIVVTVTIKVREKTIRLNTQTIHVNVPIITWMKEVILSLMT